MPDFAKIQTVLEHIERNPKNWDQRQWEGTNECGTTHCMAGWAGSIFGDKKEHHGGYSGQKILDLTEDQADKLFYLTVVQGDRCDISCQTDVMALSSGRVCALDWHNQHPTFDQYVAHVERVIPGFVYERKIVA